MPNVKNVQLRDDDQLDAWEDARALVAEDVEERDLDVSRYGGDVTDGEVLRVIAEAYRGSL